MRPVIAELCLIPRSEDSMWPEEWVFTVVGPSDSGRPKEQDVPWQVHVYDPESGNEQRFDGCTGLVNLAKGILQAAGYEA